MNRFLFVLLLAVSIISAEVHAQSVGHKQEKVAAPVPVPVPGVNPPAGTFAPVVATPDIPDAKKSGGPSISPVLTKMLSALPLANNKDKILGLVGDLKKTSCGNGLSGCFGTASGDFQLYFFSSNTVQQTFLLVMNTKIGLPTLGRANLQRMLTGTELIDPIISISTTDFTLSTSAMPPGLQKIVRDSYFNVDSLSFASGVQIEGRANIEGAMKRALKTVGVHADKLILSAGVVLPIPTDLVGAAGSGAGLVQALKDGESMSNGLKQAATPEAYIALQMGPDEIIQALFGMDMDLTDANIQFSNAGVLTVKGNAIFNSVTGKKMPLVFHTPVDPEGALDFLDFEFRLATPSAFTMQGGALVMTSFISPLPKLVQYGGSFIKGMDKLKKPLLAMSQPLSVIQLKNPQSPSEYKFGDSTKPFPTDNQFNFVLAGPLTSGGPLLKAAGDVTILGQKMGSLSAIAGINGFQGTAESAITVKLGPLGRTGIRMKATADISTTSQIISMNGNVLGRSLLLTMNDHELKIDSPATCATPFEIETKVTITPDMDIAKILDLEGGVNVDPAKLQNCIGKELEAAYGKIAGEYKNLSGYTAGEANAALKKISDGARQAYESTKNAARNVASQSSNAANTAFKFADNAFRGLGKKKRHKQGPDPKFASTVFDWDYYYDIAPDVVSAGVDLATHWRDTGFAEGRYGSREFNANFYLNRYLDVQRLCPGNFQCALQHWLDQGLYQGRQGSAAFSIESYLIRYPDLLAAFPNGDFPGAFEHWFGIGKDEGRSGSPESGFSGQLPGPLVAGGGSSQALWNDLSECGGQHVNGFRLRAGDSVDSVQFSYANRGWANPHGYQSNNPYPVEVLLPEGEYFVQVDIGAASRVDNLTFTTNRGRTFGRYGGGGPNGTFTVAGGEKLGCFAGRSGGSIDQLIFSSTGPQ